MRAHVTLTISLLSSIGLQAQVTILDPGMVEGLTLAVPLAMNGDQLDPMHPSVSALVTLDLSLLGIADVSGIEYFIGLEFLDLSDNPIPSMPLLPSSITHLDIGGVAFTDFDPLPPGLEYLYIGGNTITGLGALPASLSSLNAVMCQFVQFPNAIAQASGLVDLITDGSSFSEQPVLPEGLIHWTCADCGLVEIPPLPTSLSVLDLPMNQVSVIAEIPEHVRYLDLIDCPLTALPNIPDSLLGLWVNSTPLQFLPLLPNLMERLHCFNTEITCLPNVPEGLTSLRLPSGVECIPVPMPDAAYNYATAMGFLTPPICTNFNVLCGPEPFIEGSTWFDDDGDGLNDDGGVLMPFVQLQLDPGAMQFGTNALGMFRTHVQPGDYIVSAIPGPYQSITTAPIPATLPDMLTTVTGNHHGIAHIQDVTDMRVQLTALTEVRPGFTALYRINFQNVGTVPASGTITLAFSPQMQFMSSVPAPQSASAGNASWDFSAGVFDFSGSITVQLSAPAGTPLGTELVTSVGIAPDATDEWLSDNSDHADQIVVGSYDPNDKMVTPSMLSPADLSAGMPLDYTIRFQNTGTASALLVRITDTLDMRLDLLSFRFLASSHPCAWFIQDGVLAVVYEGINLPDSTSNEQESHGFFRFEIKPTPDLMLGETVGNVANIYFDFNDPVITEAATFSVDDETSVQERPVSSLRVFPNPAEEIVNVVVNADAAGVLITVTDALGRTVRTVIARNGLTPIDVRDLVPGAYGVRITSEAAMRFVKQ